MKPIRTFCLCIPERPDAMARSKAHFDALGVENVEFFAALHAETTGFATCHPYEIDAPGSGYLMGFKPTGVWLAHVMLWHHLARLNDDKFLILEDDAMFHEDWKARYEQAMEHLPGDFDFCHIGHCCLEGHPKTLVGGELYESKNSQCTHSYILNRKCLPFLLRTVRKCYAPIDCQLVLDVFPHLRTFAVIPRMVDQFGTVLPP